jgi:tRNA-specific 2-thiouridylase
LLKQQGFEVTGVFMTNINPETYAGECMLEELRNARQVAEFLDIPLEVVNLQESFAKKVEKKFYEEYKRGNTPNPCVECNRDIKFGELAEECFKLGADYIATGHYTKTENGSLFKSKDPSKDQTYFLNRISGEVLEKTIFPLSELTKEEVRKIAEEIELPNFNKKDSQKICFLKGMDLQKQFFDSPGAIKDIDARATIGTHSGIHNYTIGQRQGIKIGGLDKPYFVAKKDVDKNIVCVAKGRDNPALWKTKFEVKDFNFINKRNVGIFENLHGLIRYHSKGSFTTVKWDNENDQITGIFEFEIPQWAPSTGQSLVIYSGEECIGGGEITKILD